MAQRIFKDDTMQTLFDKQGFITVPFIDEADLKYLNDLFDRLHPDIPKEGFVSGSYSPDFAYKKMASDEIVKVYSKHYEGLFTNYQPFGAAFLYKVPSQSSELAIHQDWTIVDENKFVALNCWVPLTDVNETNGALHVVPGSHYDALHTVRAPTLPFFFTGQEDAVIKASVPMYVKAGEAVILNQSVIHYSPPNRSSQIRKAITAGIKSKGAPMHFFYNDKKVENALEMFEMPEDFLISFNNFYTDIFERPKMGSSKGFVDFKMPQFEQHELIKIIARMKTNAGFGMKTGDSKSIFKRIAEVFQ